MTWRDIYCSASCHPGRPRERLWKPGWIQRDTFCEIQETSWMTRAWRRFESSELLLWNESDSSCPCRPRHRGAEVAAWRHPHHNAAPCRAASTTAAAVALFDYGRLWGSFSKGSLRNEGGICSTVVKTVGSLQFCNERDAKGKGSVLLRPEPIESDFAPTTVHLPPLFLMLNSSISPLYQFELEFA